MVKKPSFTDEKNIKSILSFFMALVLCLVSLSETAFALTYTITITYQTISGTTIAGFYPSGFIYFSEVNVRESSGNSEKSDNLQDALRTNTNVYRSSRALDGHKTSSGTNNQSGISLVLTGGQLFTSGSNRYVINYQNFSASWGAVAGTGSALIESGIGNYTVQCLYPAVKLTLNLTNWDDTPYNGVVAVRSNAGVDTVTVTDGVGYTYVAIGSTNVVVWTPASGVTSNATATVHNGAAQFFLQAIPQTVPSTDYSANLKAEITKQNYTVIAKESNTSEGIPGIVFAARDERGNILQQTTDSTGKVNFYLTKVDQPITEVSFPKGYPKRNLTFTVPPTNSNITRYLGSITYTLQNYAAGSTTTRNLTYTYDPALDVSYLYLTLEDEDTQEPIRGGTFDVVSGGITIKKLVTDSYGEAVYNDIPGGSYSVTQASTAKDYNTDAVPKLITIDHNDVELSFKNSKKKGSVSVRITDKLTSGGIAGAKFILNGNGNNEMLTTDNDGYLPLTDIVYGSYVINEYDVPPGYTPKNLSVSFSLNDLTNGNGYTYEYSPAADTTQPSISFGSLPAENSADSVVQELTLTDNASGVKELKINNVTVLSSVPAGTLSTVYSHEINANGSYNYTLTDHAGNTYTTTQTVNCIKNEPIQLSDLVLSNYKTSISYSGSPAYVVNSAYSYSNVAFGITGGDTSSLEYKIELLDGANVINSTTTKATDKGNNTGKITYRDSAGNPLPDGLYTALITAYDKYNEESKSITVIVKRSPPPKPSISYSSQEGVAYISFPGDLFDEYAQKQYFYLNGTQSYSGGINVTSRGVITAIYTDLAGNKSSSYLMVSPPRIPDDDEPGGSPGTNPLPKPEDGNNVPGAIVEETRNFTVYYINIRNSGIGLDIVDAVLNLIE